MVDKPHKRWEELKDEISKNDDNFGFGHFILSNCSNQRLYRNRSMRA